MFGKFTEAVKAGDGINGTQKIKTLWTTIGGDVVKAVRRTHKYICDYW
jgi:hypothetical protein